MMREPFPLSEHLVKVHTTIDPPSYLLKNSEVDVSPVFSNHTVVDVLSDWPLNPETSLDKSQIQALQRALTKED